MSTDNLSSQVQAPGRKITLANSNEITIRYGMSALVELEREHGSIGALVKVLENAETSQVFSALSHALWAGSSRKLPLVAFIDLLDPRRVGEYSKAFGEALSEATGSGDSQGEAQAVVETATN